MQSKRYYIFKAMSFSQKNKFANLTVYDTYQIDFLTLILFDVKHSTQAEYYALIFSIKIAKKIDIKMYILYMIVIV